MNDISSIVLDDILQYDTNHIIMFNVHLLYFMQVATKTLHAAGYIHEHTIEMIRAHKSKLRISITSTHAIITTRVFLDGSY